MLKSAILQSDLKQDWLGGARGNVFIIAELIRKFCFLRHSLTALNKQFSPLKVL